MVTFIYQASLHRMHREIRQILELGDLVQIWLNNHLQPYES